MAHRFPIQEYGMNYESQPLQRHEIIAMKANPAIFDRIIISFRMMLDFYGMRLISVDSGLVDRSLPPRNFASRYNNLVRELTSTPLRRLDIDNSTSLQRFVTQQPQNFSDIEMLV
ncbi:hypothetical protein C0992_012725 [Termitomyces sp. T32_za158]|nr:hypothetical protein C0992_012725 [Termitomyces sp. T32_za158]